MSRKEKHTTRGPRKILSVVLGMAVLLLGLTGCSMRIATPPELTVAGVDITIGTTILRDLTDFEFSRPGIKVYFNDLDPRTYAYDSIPAYYDGTLYAYLQVYNPDSVTRSGINCIIYKVTFKMNSEEENSWAEDNILVNGIDFNGMTSPEVKEAMQRYKLALETDTGTLRYEDGKYKYFIKFDGATGLVSEVSVEMNIG